MSSALAQGTGFNIFFDKKGSRYTSRIGSQNCMSAIIVDQAGEELLGVNTLAIQTDLKMQVRPG